VEGVLDGVRLGDDDDLASGEAGDLGGQGGERVVLGDDPGGVRASVRSTCRRASSASPISKRLRWFRTDASTLRLVSAGTSTR